MEQTNEIKKHIKEISSKNAIEIDKKFIAQWNIILDKNLNEFIKPKFYEIFAFNNSVKQLWINIEKIFCEPTNLIKYNEKNLPKIIDTNGIELSIIENNGQINFANLFIAFEQSLPMLLKISKSFPIKSTESLAYEGDCINKMYENFLKIDKKFMTLRNHVTLLNTNNSKKKEQSVNGSPPSALLSNYQLMSTPTIRLNSVNKPILAKGLALSAGEEPVDIVATQAKHHNSTLNASISSSSSMLMQTTTIRRTTKIDPAEFIKQLIQENNPPSSRKTPHNRRKNNCSRINLSECVKSPDTRYRRLCVDNESTLLKSPSGRLTTFLQYDDEFVNKSTPICKD